MKAESITQFNNLFILDSIGTYWLISHRITPITTSTIITVSKDMMISLNHKATTIPPSMALKRGWLRSVAPVNKNGLHHFYLLEIRNNVCILANQLLTFNYKQMKKTILLTIIAGLILTMGTVATAHSRDVGYSPPKIEKNNVIIYEVSPAIQIISSYPASPDVGNDVMHVYTKDHPVAVTPAKQISQLRPERLRYLLYGSYKDRRPVAMQHNYTRPPDRPALE